MNSLVWDRIEDRIYEFGVDHGVFYPESGPGVVWNGLISVADGYVGGEVESYYFDGVKIMDFVLSKNFTARIQAYSTPKEFRPCDGELRIVPGIFATRQVRSRFGFSYRTKIGGPGNHYKIHLVYNATANRNPITYSTASGTVNLSTLEWQVNAVPPPMTIFKPTAHVVLDTRYLPLLALAEIESILYGDQDTEPSLISQPELFGLLGDDVIDGGNAYTSYTGEYDLEFYDGGNAGGESEIGVDGGTPETTEDDYYLLFLDGGDPESTGVYTFDGGEP